MAEPIIVSTTIHCTKEAAWKALTHQPTMIQWYFDNIEAFKPEVDFYTEFLIVVEDRSYTHQWRINEVKPLEKIAYDWTFAEHQGITNSAFEIKEKDGLVEVCVTITGLENMPQDIPEFTKEACEGGWRYFLDRLKTFLEKGTAH